MIESTYYTGRLVIKSHKCPTNTQVIYKVHTPSTGPKFTVETVNDRHSEVRSVDRRDSDIM